MQMNYLIGGLVFALIVSLYFNKSLYDEKNTLINDLAICKSSKVNLEDSILKQNKELDNIKVDYDNKIKEYNKKLQTPRVIIKEVKSNECEDIKSILNDVRNLKL